jgi:twitching motility protein PilT
LNLAETGHFVFSTLHTSSASWTINRYISFFPPEIQDSIADRLWDAMCGVISQRLVKKSWGKGRCWIYELMLNTPWVRNNIKKRQLSQIDSMIETWLKQWMVSVEQYAKKLIDENMVSEETLSWVFNKTWK